MSCMAFLEYNTFHCPRHLQQAYNLPNERSVGGDVTIHEGGVDIERGFQADICQRPPLKLVCRGYIRRKEFGNLTEFRHLHCDDLASSEAGINHDSAY